MAKSSGFRNAGYIAGGVVLLLLVVILSQVRLDIPLETLKDDYTDQHSEFMEVDGLDLHYRVEGEGEPLLLLHGWAASLHTWDGWVEELKEEFRVIRLDLPGFGLTGPPEREEGYSMEYYVDIVDEFLEELNIEEFHMAGNSLGGAITWNYAAEYPQKVNRIVLLNAAGYAGEDDRPGLMQLAEYNVVQFAVQYVTPRMAIRQILQGVYGDERRLEEEVVRRYHRLQLREGNRQALFEVMGAIHDLEPAAAVEKIRSVQAPTLIIWGELDEWVPVDNAYKFEGDIPDSRVVVFDNAGHVPMEELPSQTSRVAADFLKEE